MLRKLTTTNLLLLAILLATAVVNAWGQRFTVVAQSVLTTLVVSVFNANVGNDPNNHYAVGFTCGTDSTTTNSNFSDENCVETTINGVDGQYSYGGGTNAKRTQIANNYTATFNAAAQRFAEAFTINCYGIGDCFRESTNVQYAGGDIAGDEGQGFASVSYLQQQNFLSLATVSAVARTTCNTTITQNVTGGPIGQVVTVASTTGCNVNDWVVLGQAVATGSPNFSAVQITGVSAGKLTGIFANNYTSGATVTPALVLTLDSTFQMGQYRALVDLSGTSYSTGTIASISGGGLVGSGTSWAANMVGGSATNIGCISQDADTYTGSPFNGSGANGPLRSWYQITSVTDTTHLGIFSFSVAGDTSYRGKGPGAGGYKILPCASILYIGHSSNSSDVTGQLILETTSTTWTVGDSVECIITPYPDVSGFQYQAIGYTPGGNYRAWMNVTNTGARTFQNGFNLVGINMQTGGGADTVAWNQAFSASNTNVGLVLRQSHTAAINLFTAASGDAAGDTSGEILWDSAAPYLKPNSTNGGMDFQLIGSGTGGLLSSISDSVIGTGSSSSLTWSGVLGTTATTFTHLPTCGSSLEGLERSITDGSSGTFGATVAGSGTNHVKARCNGTNWVVSG